MNLNLSDYINNNNNNEAMKRTKLQKISILSGALMLIMSYVVNTTGISNPMTLLQANIAVGILFILFRLASAVFAGYLANKINRGEFLFVIFALILPPFALIILGLLKPNEVVKTESNEKELV